jgi:O-antigen/teichoic acid export membrane protein
MFIATLLSAIFLFISGVFTRNLLGPEQNGIWLSLSLIFIYGNLTQLGVVNGINREIPRILGARDDDGAQKIREAGLGWMVVPFLFSFIFIFIVLLLDLNSLMKIYTITAILLVPLQNIMNFYRITYLTINQFKQVAINQIIVGPIQSILSIIFVYYFGFWGLLLPIYIASIFSIVIFVKYLNQPIKIRWNWPTSKYLMSFGVTIMVIGLSWSLFTTIDRIMISALLGAKELGFFGISILLFQGLMMFPQVFSQVMYPKISFAYGQNNTKDHLLELVSNPSIIFAFLNPYVIGVIFYLFPVFVRWLMPEYIKGIDTASIMVLGTFYLGIVATFASYLNSANKNSQYLILLIISIICNVVINFIVIKSGYGIEGVAVATALVYFIYSHLIIITCLKILNLTGSEILRKLFHINLPFFIMVILLLAIHSAHLGTVSSVLLYLLAYTIILFFISGKINELQVLKKIVKGKVGESL